MKSQVNVLTENEIEYYFGFILKSLRTIGLKFSMSEKTAEFKFIHKLPTIIGCAIGALVFVFEIYFIRDALHNHTMLPMQVISQVISNLQAVSKGMLIVIKVKKIQEIMDKIHVLWKTYSPDEGNRVTLYNTLHRTLFICKVYYTVMILTLMTYYVQPIVNFSGQYKDRNNTNHTYDYSQTLTIIKLPFEVTRNRYFIVITHEAFLLYMSCLYWACSDALFACFTTQICYHLKILKYHAEAVFNDEKSKNSRLNLVTLIKRHQNILRFCELTEDVYSPIIFSTMLFSAINLCINVIGLRETVVNGSYRQAGMHLCLFIVTFSQILFYCDFAEELTEEARSLADLAYNLEWTTRDCKLRCYIQMIILRAQKPFYCTAYGFFPIGIQKLTSIINASFSYYMMLQTVS